MIRLYRQTSFALIVGVVALLNACAPKVYAPVEERIVISSAQETEQLGGSLVRVVQSGDTLYSIAFANSLDVNRLAQWNNIVDTRKLQAGQQLRLTPPEGFVLKPIKPTLKGGSTEPDLEPKVYSEAQPKANQTKPNFKRSESRVVAIPGSINQKKESVERQPNSPPTITPKPVENKLESWSWPVNGKVIETFSVANGQQGIAIAGDSKTPVLATKPGEVVYVGDGLKGYGNLIIVKHDEYFLSAYAHNLTTFVTEGQSVTRKQKIGLLGADNKSRNAIHFQVRKEGKPVNPLSYLPAR